MGLLVIFDRKRKNEEEIERQVVRGGLSLCNPGYIGATTWNISEL